VTRNLYKDATGITQLQKPDKLYLENTNFQFVLAPHASNKGSVRETFAANQLGYQNSLEYTANGDFLIDGIYTLEIGGTHRGGQGNSQIEGIPNAYILADDIEYGNGNKIPLWLLGFLY
jgi:hypothetical protein